jgi:hypothetical protein
MLQAGPRTIIPNIPRPLRKNARTFCREREGKTSAEEVLLDFVLVVILEGGEWIITPLPPPTASWYSSWLCLTCTLLEASFSALHVSGVLLGFNSSFLVSDKPDGGVSVSIMVGENSDDDVSHGSSNIVNSVYDRRMQSFEPAPINEATIEKPNPLAQEEAALIFYFNVWYHEVVVSNLVCNRSL